MSFLKSLLVMFSIIMMSNCVYAEQSKTGYFVENGEKIKVNKDSIALVKLVQEFSKDSLKLANLKSQVEEKTKVKEETEAIAQKLANENNKVARQLSKDPLEKKLAKKADKLSSEARSSAKKARAAANALKSLNKSIVSLERKIEKHQSKMAKLKVAIQPSIASIQS